MTKGNEMNPDNSRFRTDVVDEKRAVLTMVETEYNQLLGKANPMMLHRDWADFDAWVQACIKKGIDSGWPVKVYEATADEVMAYWYTIGGDLQTSTLLQYAAHLLGRELREK